MAKYCSNCGNKVDENAYICLKCGVVVNNNMYNQNSNIEDKGGFGWGALGFFVPMAGLILYLIWKNERPKTAKSAGIGALVSVVLNILLVIFMIFMAFSFEDVYDDHYYYDDYYYNFE